MPLAGLVLQWVRVLQVHTTHHHPYHDTSMIPPLQARVPGMVMVIVATHTDGMEQSVIESRCEVAACMLFRC